MWFQFCVFPLFKISFASFSYFKISVLWRYVLYVSIQSSFSLIFYEVVLQMFIYFSISHYGPSFLFSCSGVNAWKPPSRGHWNNCLRGWNRRLDTLLWSLFFSWLLDDSFYILSLSKQFHTACISHWFQRQVNANMYLLLVYVSWLCKVDYQPAVPVSLQPWLASWQGK